MTTSNKHGFFTDMSNEDYHAANGISKSGLDKVEVSPLHFHKPKPFNQTRFMEIGTAIHAAILEPARFKTDYNMTDAKDRRCKEYKEYCEGFTKETTMAASEVGNILGMQKSVEADPEAQLYLRQPGQAELSAFATDPETGIQIRARYDWITEKLPMLNGGRVVVDVKKVQDITAFGKSVNSYRYHVQEAMYRHVFQLIEGYELDAFYFLAVEENTPHACKMFTLSREALEVGRYYMRKNLNAYAAAVQSGHWPAPEVDSVIDLPQWAYNKHDALVEIDEANQLWEL